MADSTPPPPPTDQLLSAPQPPSEGGTTATRGLKVLVLTVVLTLFVGGGAFAFFTLDPFHLFRSGPQASEALPANAIFYAGVDLDPMASQKVDALRFFNHFPAFRENAGLPDAQADVADSLVGKAIDKLDCPGVSYADDVQPWLGDRFGLAVMPSTGQSGVPVVFAVQVSDESAARDGIAALNACDAATSASPTGNAIGISYNNGYLLIAETQAQADAYARSAADHALADEPAFKADMDSLGGLGVATMWVDVAGAVNSYADLLPATAPLDGLTSTVGRVAATFRFASDHIEVASTVFGDTAPIDHDANPVVDLPDSTVFALSESGGGQRVAAAWQKGLDQLRNGDPSVDDQIAQFETQTGLSVPADLETLFGHNLMFALDARGLTADGLSAGDISRLDFGARFTNDPAKLDALYTKVSTLIGAATGTDVPLVKKDFDDGIAVASNEAYADQLGQLDGTLGDSDAFTSVVEDGAAQELVIFFNFEAIKDQVLQAMVDDGAPQQAIDNVRPLKAFGITTNVEGDYQHLTMRLSVDE